MSSGFYDNSEASILKVLRVIHIFYSHFFTKNVFQLGTHSLGNRIANSSVLNLPLIGENGREIKKTEEKGLRFKGEKTDKKKTNFLMEKTKRS